MGGLLNSIDEQLPRGRLKALLAGTAQVAAVLATAGHAARFALLGITAVRGGAASAGRLASSGALLHLLAGTWE